MALVKIADYYPDYKDKVFGGEDVIGYSIYNDRDEKLGDVHDILLDDDGRFRYFVVDMGFWIFGKRVLLPVGRTRMDFNRHRVYALGMTQQQAEALPDYHEDTSIDHQYEENVRNVYRPTVAAQTTPPAYTPESYQYDYDKELYETREADHSNLKLYEERLVANKDRFKSGEVAIGKRVETESARVAVPIEKERVIIERTSPSSVEPVAPGTAAFQSGEVTRMEVYEETANVQKEAFVREEVNIRKEVEHETVSSEEQIRREELEVDVDGNPVIKRDIK